MIKALEQGANALGRVNAAAVAAGLWAGAACLGVMLAVILIQVFFRYVLGNALAWSEEAARFLMLWMTGLMVPAAFRQGGFVAVTLIVEHLPRRAGQVLEVLFLILTLLILWIGLRIGWAEVTGLGGRFAMSALAVPASLDLATWVKVPRAAMMAALALGITLLFSVNVELLARALARLLGGGGSLAPVLPAKALGVE